MLLVFLTVFALSSCEEEGEIQFIVVDEFETTIQLTGLANESSFSVSNSTDISELLDNASTFVDAEVEKVTVTLQNDYSGSAINGNLNVTIGGVAIINQSVNLTKGVGVDVSLANAADILSVISSGSFPFNVTGTSAAPLGDDDFSLALSFKVKATVE